MKPIWAIRMITQHFGPVGKGWGMGEPSFQVVPTKSETLVYCTVMAWHTKPENCFYGVGGDKVVASRKEGAPFCDDEAFKKAYTDALLNAFKMAGVGGDIHMGQHDDDKYIEEMEREFEPKVEMITDADRDEIQAMIEGYGFNVLKVCQHYKIASLKEIPASEVANVKAYLNNAFDKKKEKVA